MKGKKSNNLIIASLLTAVGASLCCITPVLAFVAGISGVASTFSWLDPLRPYLMVFTVLVLGFAWYKMIKPRKTDCACETSDKKSFWHSKKFLSIVTLFAALMLVFPYYSGIFFPAKDKAQTIIVKESDINEATLSIEGMTCQGCEHSVNHVLMDKEGVIEATASYENGMANVKFDGSKLEVKALKETVEKETGYKVTGIKTKDR